MHTVVLLLAFIYSSCENDLYRRVESYPVNSNYVPRSICCKGARHEKALHRFTTLRPAERESINSNAAFDDGVVKALGVSACFSTFS